MEQKLEETFSLRLPYSFVNLRETRARTCLRPATLWNPRRSESVASFQLRLTWLRELPQLHQCSPLPRMLAAKLARRGSLSLLARPLHQLQPSRSCKAAGVTAHLKAFGTLGPTSHTTTLGGAYSMPARWGAPPACVGLSVQPRPEQGRQQPRPKGCPTAVQLFFPAPHAWAGCKAAP